ncbi:hypothetical protein LSS_14336 [Leptospira santarosai serovar Shermani str. LT 821]|uniref:Uncharacterized protein n=1 Tax=Leptospira santarosai serovar Shermani str. LT 821 TaxID=758847 RepID=K8Y8J7_9LEPT|nr:hypothetical protein LSS_14336 [Leptospira santarosai serovar Shermani str. LT 821]EPG81456.1 hypothetical protein LEP1GSC048_2133 [Leptospira santarosai serovar Shermani str. 1342KT]
MGTPAFYYEPRTTISYHKISEMIGILNKDKVFLRQLLKLIFFKLGNRA